MQWDNDVNAREVQAQTVDQMRIEELLCEMRKLEKRIQFYDKGFRLFTKRFKFEM